MIKEKIPHANPVGIQGFIFNIRKPLFADRKVREALIYAFDFEMVQQDPGRTASTRAPAPGSRTRRWKPRARRRRKSWRS